MQGLLMQGKCTSRSRHLSVGCDGDGLWLARPTDHLTSVRPSSSSSDLKEDEPPRSRAPLARTAGLLFLSLSLSAAFVRCFPGRFHQSFKRPGMSAGRIKPQCLLMQERRILMQDIYACLSASCMHDIRTRTLLHACSYSATQRPV